MKIKILREAGYKEAMLGLSLSYGTTIKRASEIAPKLAHKQGGHNKFLESIYLWIDITAPRYFWQQADTYRLVTKQSESTMHTALKRPLEQKDFENAIFEPMLNLLNNAIEDKNLDEFKTNLPESFLQRRIWVMSYKTLQNIIVQREKHKLKEWQMFCQTLQIKAQHKEFLI